MDRQELETFALLAKGGTVFVGEGVAKVLLQNL
jgi:hypothetical protein